MVFSVKAYSLELKIFVVVFPANYRPNQDVRRQFLAPNPSRITFSVLRKLRATKRGYFSKIYDTFCWRHKSLISRM